jgi:cytochrome c-type biogenesis protein CcmH/NrfF
MDRYRFGRRSDYGERRRRWPRSRAAGCLLWVVLLVVLLIVLSVLFGGFQKGTQYKGLGPVGQGRVQVCNSPRHDGLW